MPPGWLRVPAICVRKYLSVRPHLGRALPSPQEAELCLGVLSIFSPNILQVLVDPLYGPPSHVPVALVGTLSVVVDKPLVKDLLQGFHRLVKLLSKGLAEELIQHCSVEPLHEPVRLRVPYLRGAVPNLV